MARIPLRRRDGSIRAYAIVDDADFEWLSRWRWSMDRQRRAYRGTRDRRAGTQTTIFLHAQIGDARHLDHVNGDKLDNRRKNLRECPRGQRDNMQNRGANRHHDLPRGVHRHSMTKKLRARATLDGREYHLGLFDTAEQADAAVKAFRAVHMPFSEDARARLAA